MNTPRNADRIVAREVESTGNLVSGLGEHGLANQLWALAGKLRSRAERGDASPLSLDERWRLGRHNPYTVYEDHGEPYDADDAAAHCIGFFRKGTDAARAVNAHNSVLDYLERISEGMHIDRAAFLQKEAEDAETHSEAVERDEEEPMPMHRARQGDSIEGATDEP